MPGGELFDGSAHRWLVYHLKLDRKPSLEPGQRFITGNQHTGVFEHAAQMVDRFVGTGLVEADMGQRDLPVGQTGQQFLNAGRAPRRRGQAVREVLAPILTFVSFMTSR